MDNHPQPTDDNILVSATFLFILNLLVDHLVKVVEVPQHQSVFNVQSARLIVRPMLFMKHQLNLISATHGRLPNQNKSMVY